MMKKRRYIISSESEEDDNDDSSSDCEFDHKNKNMKRRSYKLQQTRLISNHSSSYNENIFSKNEDTSSTSSCSLPVDISGKEEQSSSAFCTSSISGKENSSQKEKATDNSLKRHSPKNNIFKEPVVYVKRLSPTTIERLSASSSIISNSSTVSVDDSVGNYNSSSIVNNNNFDFNRHSRIKNINLEFSEENSKFLSHKIAKHKTDFLKMNEKSKTVISSASKENSISTPIFRIPKVQPNKSTNIQKISSSFLQTKKTNTSRSKNKNLHSLLKNSINREVKTKKTTQIKEGNSSSFPCNPLNKVIKTQEISSLNTKINHSSLFLQNSVNSQANTQETSLKYIDEDNDDILSLYADSNIFSDEPHTSNESSHFNESLQLEKERLQMFNKDLEGTCMTETNFTCENGIGNNSDVVHCNTIELTSYESAIEKEQDSEEEVDLEAQNSDDERNISFKYDSVNEGNINHNHEVESENCEGTNSKEIIEPAFSSDDSSNNSSEINDINNYNTNNHTLNNNSDSFESESTYKRRSLNETLTINNKKKKKNFFNDLSKCNDNHYVNSNYTQFHNSVVNKLRHLTQNYNDENSKSASITNFKDNKNLNVINGNISSFNMCNNRFNLTQSVSYHSPLTNTSNGNITCYYVDL